MKDVFVYPSKTRVAERTWVGTADKHIRPCHVDDRAIWKMTRTARTLENRTSRVYESAQSLIPRISMPLVFRSRLSESGISLKSRQEDDYYLEHILQNAIKKRKSPSWLWDCR